MGYNYGRLKKKKEDSFSYWTSYSDLFMMLSSVFLLLYVTASLTSGTFGAQKNAELERLTHEVADLKEQLRVYNTLRDDQVAGASSAEKQVYTNLMDKLSLLKDQASNEKEKLQKEAEENEQKEDALNRYQQLIRNIINANILAKSQIQRRDGVIHQQGTQIQALNGEVSDKEKTIAENNQRIDEIKGELTAKIANLRDTQREAHTSHRAMERQIAELKEKSAAEIDNLNQQNAQTKQELSQAQSTLSTAQEKIAQTNAALEQTTQDLENVKNKNATERAALVSKLEQMKSGYQDQINALQSEGDQKLANQRKAFEDQLAKEKLNSGEVAKREKDFQDKAAGEARALQGKIAALQGKVGDSERRLNDAIQDQARAHSAVQNLEKEKAGMAQELKKARDLVDAKKRLAQAIRNNFAKAGIKADVNSGTGEVTLAFPDDYFDTGKAQLKPGMEQRLSKFIPAYAKSLFSDPDTAEKISNIEIIGFASSTFKGRYVNPKSLNPKDRQAIDYNLKLSFTRAKSIFGYIFDTQQLTYKHQRDLLPLVKVVGRGYLPDGKQASDIPEGMPEEEFCKKYNCEKAQKVVIKFNLKN